MKRTRTLPNYGERAGKNFITAGRRIVAGPYASCHELDAAMREQFPGHRDSETGEDVFATYYPTVSESRKWDRMGRAQDAFNVEYWRVFEDRRIGKHRIIGSPLSPKFGTRQECRQALARIKGINPRAYAGRATIFFNWLRPADIAERKALLDEIRCIPSRRRTAINSRTEVSHA